ncbi:hypothetical protein YC2023_040965 [Brassica napus]
MLSSPTLFPNSLCPGNCVRQGCFRLQSHRFISMRNNVKSKKKRVEQKGNREQMEIGCYSLGDLPTTDYKERTSKRSFSQTVRTQKTIKISNRSSCQDESVSANPRVHRISPSPKAFLILDELSLCSIRSQLTSGQLQLAFPIRRVPFQLAPQHASVLARSSSRSSLFQLASRPARGSLGGPVLQSSKPKDYAALNLFGDNYLQWALDTEIVLKSKGLGECIIEDNNASESNRYREIMITRQP